MIDITLSDSSYEYDVYTLVKAFYPDETVKIIKEEKQKQADTSSNRIYSQPNELDNILTDEKKLNLIINFLTDSIEISFYYEGQSVKTCNLNLDSAILKSQYKNKVKRFLYKTLNGLTGKELTWGILTGIRPTKLVYDMLARGLEEVEIQKRMQEEYLCSHEKIKMSLRIAKKELDLLKAMDYQNGYSLYIGIPFCPSTCLYCSFTSYSITKFSNLVEEYLSALEKEIGYAATCFPSKKLTTVYFGGGTPTTLTAEQLDRLLGMVRQSFDFSNVKEFCVEAGRPDSITKEKLEVLKKWGVDRISINPQSMQQRTLDLIGRQHTVTEIKEAFHLARETGHENINMDIIIGLPGEKPEDVRDTLSQINSLNPDSLTVHTLALKRAARLNIQKESYHTLKAPGVSEMLEDTIKYAEENDYLPYYLYRQKNMADNLENIGYSRCGKEGLYNILIMEEKQTILALGAGGMSKFVIHEENRIERVDNVKSVTDYIGRIDEMISRKREFLKTNPQL